MRAEVRRLPIALHAPDPPRRLPLADSARDVDRACRPIYCVWEITLACDLACRHCGSRAGRARSDELTTAECLDLVRQMAELGVKEVTLIGGEAYLRSDWVEIVAAIVDHGMWATMTTGGRGLTRERALAGARAGLKSTSVSVDGSEATHDRLRGVEGSYRAAFEALQHLRDAGVSSSTGGSSTGGSSSGSGGDGAVGPVYGLPADASTSDAPAAGGTFSNDGGPIPLYGAAP
jgi:sulfatase maturation enzyme AslB (radical SAM superfamily)